MKNSFSLKKAINVIGLPRLIIGSFFVFILILGHSLGQSLGVLMSDTLVRVGMNGILVLAMVPSIQSGTGPNFALPVGIVCGLLGQVLSIEIGATGFLGFGLAILLSIPFAIIVGYLYGKLLNAVKGSEMTIATYTGFSIVSLMCIVWLTLPLKSEAMGFFIGEGLRQTIALDNFYGGILNNFLAFNVGGLTIPTGLIAFFLLFCFIVYLFFKSKTGIAISATGNNAKFATAAGIDIDKSRIQANILSTILAAIGIVVYSQSFGFVQLYTAPLMMAFPAVAAILIGGATAKRASVSHVIIGTFLFQGLLTTALPVANEVFTGGDLSEILRMTVQNGIILYALTKVTGGEK